MSDLGFSTKIDLAVGDGFSQAIKLLDDLFNKLNSIKTLAGNLGDMKLKVSFNSSGNSPESIKEPRTILQQKAEYLRAYHDIPKGVSDKGVIQLSRSFNQQEKERMNQEKDSTDESKDFGSALKWVTGTLLTFEAIMKLAKWEIKAFTENLKNDISISGNATRFGMTDSQYQILQNTGQIYGGNKEAFDPALKNLKTLMSNPRLIGNLNTEESTKLYTGLGLSPNAILGMRNNPMEALKYVSNGLLKALASGDKGKIGLATEFSDSAFGEDFTNSLNVMNKTGIKNFDQALGVSTAATSTGNTQAGVDFSVEGGKTNVIFGGLGKDFQDEIANDFIEPLRTLNNVLEKTKPLLEGFAKGTVDFIALLFGSGPWAKGLNDIGGNLGIGFTEFFEEIGRGKSYTKEELQKRDKQLGGQYEMGRREYEDMSKGIDYKKDTELQKMISDYKTKYETKDEVDKINKQLDSNMRITALTNFDTSHGIDPKADAELQSIIIQQTNNFNSPVTPEQVINVGDSAKKATEDALRKRNSMTPAQEWGY